jgi:hypothetical protein
MPVASAILSGFAKGLDASTGRSFGNCQHRSRVEFAGAE